MVFSQEIRSYFYSTLDNFLNELGFEYKRFNNSQNHRISIIGEQSKYCDNKFENYTVKFRIGISILDIDNEDVKEKNVALGIGFGLLMPEIDRMWFKYRGYGHYSSIQCWDDIYTLQFAREKTYELLISNYGSEIIICKLAELKNKNVDIIIEQIKDYYSTVIVEEIQLKANIDFLNKIANTPIDNYIHSNEMNFGGDRIMRKLILARLSKNPEYSKIYDTIKEVGDSIQSRIPNELDEELIYSIKNFNVRLNKIHNDLQNLKID